MTSELMSIPVEEVLPNPEQPRINFDPIEIQSLSQSIKEHGLIQPIVVEKHNDSYILIDGERRLRAVKLLGLPTIEAKVAICDADKKDKLSQALIANLQRADLNPIEEAKAYFKLQEYRVTQRTIAAMSGRSISHVTARLKLLELEPDVQRLFAARKLPIDPGFVYSLFRLPPDQRVSLSKKWAANGTTLSIINRTITRLLNRADKPDVDLSRGKRSPISVMSNQEENKTATQILVQLEKCGALPIHDLITSAAEETCTACDLHDIASAQMCRDCPAVDLLKRLHIIIQQQGASVSQ